MLCSILHPTPVLPMKSLLAALPFGLLALFHAPVLPQSPPRLAPPPAPYPRQHHRAPALWLRKRRPDRADGPGARH
ncbi:MAG: hypothetical protein WKG07_48245 [Hymenobacter sp.]